MFAVCPELKSMLYAFSKSGLSSKKPTSGERDSMSDEVKKYNEVFEVRLTPGNSGDDPEAPNWEVWEIKADSEEFACDNLTQTEAQAMADMWTKKRDEAEAEP